MTVPSRSSSFMGIIETSLKSVDDRVLQYIIWKVVPWSTTRWVKVGFRNTGINLCEVSFYRQECSSIQER